MRVRIAGAGPAGLYLALLLKKADPRHEIAVVERNPPDATFGWGVVFSEETLGSLRDADQPTYTEITDTFARWPTVDIRYRGTLLRSRGHAFSAISRKVLLQVLQRRALELGVVLCFEREIASMPEFADGADLVVGADGVNSVVRSVYAERFGSRVVPQGCRYVWFGTDLVLDAFTFVFKETDAGLVNVHAYPFDENTSTWIVECPEPTWRRLGFDEMDEDGSLKACEALFADELDGHRLLSNRSVWGVFQRVRNEHWHAGNVVLVGDAAHTAHFSIGSGTKLAMEDAIALAQALERRPDDLGRALAEYGLERQPVVERFQHAAGESAAFFGRLEHYSDTAPVVFAFNLLTRSGRVTHANLAQRDPQLVRVLDAWFHGDGTVPAGSFAPPPVFAPWRDLPNRIVRAARGPDEVRSLVGSGAGLVLCGPVAVTRDGRVSPDTPTVDDAERWAGALEEVHRAGARTGILLTHAGRRGSTRPPDRGADVPLRSGSWPLVAPSAIAYAPGMPVPRAMDAGDMAVVRDSFVAAASRSAAAGFDVLELDMGYGYLLASFLSPASNRREDRFGGDPEGRLRFPLEVLDAVRQAWPEAKLLAVRLNVADGVRGALGLAEGIGVARALAAHGCDVVHVVAGQTVAEEPRADYRPGFLTPLADRVRAEARVATMVGGYLTTPDEANTIVGAGRADLCLMEPPHTDLERELAAVPG